MKQERQGTTPSAQDIEKNGGMMIFGFMILFALSFLMIFYSPKFEVDSVMVYPFNIFNSSEITANWSVTFSVYNPNIVYNLQFEDIKASILYKNQDIASTTMENFRVKIRQKRTLQANMSISSMDIGRWIAEAMAADWSHGAVNFSVKIDIDTVIAGGDTDEMFSITALSKDVKVGFSSPNMTTGIMLGGSKRCNVDYFNPVNILYIPCAVIFFVGSFGCLFIELIRFCCCCGGRKVGIIEDSQTGV